MAVNVLKSLPAMAILLAVLGHGCATAPTPIHPLDQSRLGPDALILQRGILSARGKEFALNGYLARSQTGGLRLVVTEMLGQVLADVLIKPSGEVHVMRATTMIRPEWIRRYMAADVACLFGGLVDPTAKVETLSPDHFRVKRRYYSVDVRTTETRPGPQPLNLFDETQKNEP